MNVFEKIYCRTYQLFFRVALPVLPYREPELLDSLQKLPSYLRKKNISSVLMITDRSLRSLGVTDYLEHALADNDISCTVFDDVEPNPTIQLVESCREKYLASGAQAMIAFGGGSAMDCAKAAGARVARPEKSVKKMGGLLKVMRRTPLLIAVPTTAGTGSEATLAAVITDPSDHHKYPINDFALIPDVAVLDYHVTLGLPPMVTATTGMDALTHAVEAYIGRSTNKFTRAMAEEAVILIAKYLRRAYENGHDSEARAKMLRAAYCAGNAFTRSYVGYVHGLAHSLGGRYGVPHGLANAVILPYFLKVYGSACHKPLAKLARKAGLAGANDSDSLAAGKFIEWVEQMNASMNIPTSIPEIRAKDIPAMAAYAAKESNPLYPVPVLMDQRKLEGMYIRIMTKAGKETSIDQTVEKQREFFSEGKTLSVDYRLSALDRLYESITKHEEDINAALRSDLNKSPAESYMCETGMTLSELSHVRKHLRRWAKDRRVATPIAQFHSKSFEVKQPYGVTLVMSPWNYPFMLTMEPLIGAVAAGNCCVVKPSAYSPATSSVIRKIISECFPPEYVTVVEGGRAENKALLDQKFDYIFFTGGVAVGKEVMEKAARHLTPVTLELGGKSPCIVDRTAKLDLAAKRLVFGKLLNCGQTCVAPDYLLIERSIKDTFLEYVRKWIARMYGENALTNDGYVKMINQKHFDRVCGLIDPDKVVIGGGSDPATLKIQPTVMDNVTPDDAIMQEEIFGPVLPVLTFDKIEEAENFVKNRPHPLALYLFTENKAVKERFLRRVSFGGGCINDTIIHLATSNLGFGGVGNSGMGSYHGKKSFDTFSHTKSIVDKSTWMDLPMRYAPYSETGNKLIRMFMK